MTKLDNDHRNPNPQIVTHVFYASIDTWRVLLEEVHSKGKANWFEQAMRPLIQPPCVTIDSMSLNQRNGVVASSFIYTISKGERWWW